MHRMGAQRGGKVTGVCPSAALDSLPPSEPRAPFPATAVGATSVAVAFPSLLLPQTAADGASRPPGGRRSLELPRSVRCNKFQSTANSYRLLSR